jgi:hypothetical protein
MSRLNHSTAVLDLEGTPIPDVNGPKDSDGKPRPMNMRSLVMIALNSAAPQLPVERKVRVFEISTKFYKGKYVKLTVDERTFIKEIGGPTMTPMAYGRLCEWLEGNEQFVATDEDDGDDDDSDDTVIENGKIPEGVAAESA